MKLIYILNFPGMKTFNTEFCGDTLENDQRAN